MTIEKLTKLVKLTKHTRVGDSVKDASKQEVERAINNLGYKVKRWTEYKGDVSAHVDPRDVDNDGYEYFNKQVKKLKQYAKDVYADGNEIVFFQAKFSAKDSVKDAKTAQGYEVEKIIKSKSGRLYCIMNRKVDYAIGAGYNQQRGDWDQGYYGYTSLDQALKALPGVMKRAGEVMDAVKDSGYDEYIRFLKQKGVDEHSDTLLKEAKRGFANLSHVAKVSGGWWKKLSNNDLKEIYSKVQSMNDSKKSKDAVDLNEKKTITIPIPNWDNEEENKFIKETKDWLRSDFNISVNSWKKNGKINGEPRYDFTITGKIGDLKDFLEDADYSEYKIKKLLPGVKPYDSVKDFTKDSDVLEKQIRNAKEQGILLANAKTNTEEQNIYKLLYNLVFNICERAENEIKSAKNENAYPAKESLVDKLYQLEIFLKGQMNSARNLSAKSKLEALSKEIHRCYDRNRKY